MRERARDKGRLEDIIEYSDNVAHFVEGINYDTFTANTMLYYAVMKNVEIIGEATFMITKVFKAAHPKTPWKMIESMRHILVHDYANVIPRILWNTVTEDLPTFKRQAEDYLSNTDWDEWIKAENMFNDTQDAVYKSIIGIARNMKAKGMPTEEIMEITGLSEPEIEEII